MQFRSKSTNVAKAFNHRNIELGGITIINEDVEAMVKNMNFKHTIAEVSEVLGGQPGEMIDVFVKMFPLK